MTELSMGVLLSTGPAYWMLGGSVWKGFRRLLWPLTVVVLLTIHGLPTFLPTLVGVTLLVVNSLPYGDRVRWPLRLLVCQALCWPAAWLALSYGWFYALMGAFLGLLMVISRRWNLFTWKIWEAVAGMTQATVLIIGALARHG